MKIAALLVLLIAGLVLFGCAQAPPAPTPTATIYVPTETAPPTAPTITGVVTATATAAAHPMAGAEVAFTKEPPKYTTVSGGLVWLPIRIGQPGSTQFENSEVRLAKGDMVVKQRVSVGAALYKLRIETFYAGAPGGDIVIAEFNPSQATIMTESHGNAQYATGSLDIPVKFTVLSWTGQPQPSRQVKLENADDGKTLLTLNANPMGIAEGTLQLTVMDQTTMHPVVGQPVVFGEGGQTDTEGTNLGGLVTFSSKIGTTKGGTVTLAGAQFPVTGGSTEPVIFRVSLTKGAQPVQASSFTMQRGTATADSTGKAAVPFLLTVKEGYTPKNDVDVKIELPDGKQVITGRTDGYGQLRFNLDVQLT